MNSCVAVFVILLNPTVSSKVVNLIDFAFPSLGKYLGWEYVDYGFNKNGWVFFSPLFVPHTFFMLLTSGKHK